MPHPGFGAMLVAIGGLAALSAADIQGVVIIKHKLTKRKVTLPAGPYDRGVTVGAPAESTGNPLDFERRHVVVYLDGEFPGGAVPPTAVMEQKNRRFVPDLLAIPVGATVSFPNLDPIFHNVFSLSKPKSFDLGNYPAGHTRTVTFSKPGVVLVNCHLHSNMAAAIMVTPNRWSAIPSDDGRFTLRNTPPGKHVLFAWHKAAGFFRQTITVDPVDGAHVEFVIPLDENGARTVAQR
jgi:plastocyanin